MNPIEAELLNYVEKYSRSKQVKALQLLNQAQAARSRQPTLLQKVMNRLGDLLLDARQRLGEWNVSPDRQRHGQAQ
jgi:hypothetical protein